jgi:ribosome biogenesis GTPase
MNSKSFSFVQELEWGWSSFFEGFYWQQSERLKDPALARIVSESHGIYQIVIPSLDKTALARICGKIHFKVEDREFLPAVGDWVVIDKASGAEGELRIEEILPRSSLLRRKAPGERGYNQVFASNLDEVWIATSLNQDFSENRLDRILSLVADGGARPRILLTKVDLLSESEKESYRQIMEKRFPRVPFEFVSAFDEASMSQLKKLLQPRQTYMIVGSSGVGKSTIINRLLGEERLATQEVRLEDSKGRHTTTHRQLLKLPQGAMLIDTPGVREWQLLEEDNSVASFEDVEALFLKCRFTNCRHENEPGCAVKVALYKGELSQERWDSYLRLTRAGNYQSRKADKALQVEEKSKRKSIRKNSKVLQKKRIGL